MNTSDEMISMQEGDIKFLPVLSEQCKTLEGRQILMVKLINHFHNMSIEEKRTFVKNENHPLMGPEADISLACFRLAFLTLNKASVPYGELKEEASKIHEEFISEVQKFHQEHGIKTKKTQKELASEWGISVKTLTSWECGRRRPSTDMAVKFINEKMEKY